MWLYFISLNFSLGLHCLHKNPFSVIRHNIINFMSGCFHKPCILENYNNLLLIPKIIRKGSFTMKWHGKNYFKIVIVFQPNSDKNIATSNSGILIVRLEY